MSSKLRTGTRGRVLRRPVLWFAAAEVVAFPLSLVWGRHGWFTQDDWDFLSARTVGSAHDLLRAHFQHWTTLPILVYRLMWVLVGMRSYTAYQALVVALHLVAAALLLVVIRRSGVRPWLATVVAVIFLFFGSGAENILVAFQITFVGSLVFGLTQLLLADHDGALDRRDWLGLLAGFAGLLCSGVAVTMAFVVGLAVLLRRGRRGWRVALFHTAPLGIAYVLWLQLAPTGQSAGNYRSQSPTQVIRFVLVGIEAAFARLGQVPGVGVLLGLVLVGGMVVILRRRERRTRLGSLAAPIALVAGGLVFLVVTGVVRSGQGALLARAAGTGPERARDSRYVYLIAAMTLPALALGADALTRRWRQLSIPVVLVLVAGVPGNIHALATPSRYFANAQFTRVSILAIPHLPMADQLRDSRHPVPIQRLVPEGLTFGWLIDAESAGKIPGPGPLYPIQVSTWILQFYLVPAPVSASADCLPAPKASIRELAKGQKLTFERGRVSVAYLPVDGVRSFPVIMKPTTVMALAGPLRLIIKPVAGAALICG